MSGDDAIEVAGDVTGVLPAGRYRVVLSNGHRLVARVPRRRLEDMGEICPGSRVRLSVCPGDMSQGLVVEVLKRITRHESSRFS